MLDVLLTAVICCLVTLLLLKRTNRIVAFAVTIFIGLMVGWQILNLFPVEQTSLGYLLEIDPELNMLWQQTHDIRVLSKVSRYAQYYLMAFNVFGAMLGYALALVIHRRRGVSI